MQGRGDIDVKDNLRVAENAIFDKGLDAPYLRMIDEKPRGAAGGDFLQDQWVTRDLTVVPNNDFARVTIATSPGAGGEIEVQEGEYYIEASAPASNVNEHQLRLVDVTDRFYPTIIFGTTEFAPDVEKWRDSAGFYMLVASSAQTRSFVEGRFTVNRQSKLELQHRCAVSKGLDGLGVDAAFYPADNTFTTLNMWVIRGDGDPALFYVGTVEPPAVPQVSGFSGVFSSSDPGRLATTSPFLRDFDIPNASTEAFTMSIWARRDSASINQQFLFEFGRGSTAVPDENIFAMFHGATADSNKLEARLFADATPNGQKLYLLNTLPAVGEWYMFTATYDGTNNSDAFQVYLNGVEDTSPTKSADTIISPITQINCPGSIGTTATGTSGADHTIFSVALWNKELSAAEIEAMYNEGDGSRFDILTDSGDYQAADEVVSWWLPGKDITPNIGKDYGPNSNNFNFESNVTRTSDVPDGT